MPPSLPRPLVLLCAVLALVVLLGTGHQKRDAISTALADRRQKWVAGKRKRFSKVVCFGDSLSDAGNGAWLFTNKTWPSDKSYVGHRFTNGPVYSEYVAQELGVPLISYGESLRSSLSSCPSLSPPRLTSLSLSLSHAATGGASISHRVSSRSGEHGMLPVDCIMDQIAKYSVGKTDESSTLFILYAGANDAYFSLEEGGTPVEVLADLKECIEMLRKIGAEYIVIPTLPPLGDNYPYSNALPDAAEPMRFFSTELHKIYSDWTRTQPGLAFADFFSLFDNIMKRPAEFGFNQEYLKVGCIKEKCGVNVREYIWFDDYHPTTYVHSLMAD
ncbi:lipolytic enzyme, G-D-S-L family, partial [Rhodotorula toruloides]